MAELRAKTSSGAMSATPTLTPSTISSIGMEKEAEFTFSALANSSDSASSVGSSPYIIQVPFDATEKMEDEKCSAVRPRPNNSQKEIQSGDRVADYPSGLKLGLIVLAICLSILLMALDNAIITTAIPKITDTFHSLPDVGWYGSSYMLTAASLQLFFGKLYTYLSIKWLFLTAVGIFELGSLICGIAPNSLTLIMGRAVAGVGCAGLMTGGLLILAASVPLAKRPFYTGLIGSMYGVASVAGPLLGGVFTDKLTWRWCFYINLPFGLVTLCIVSLFFSDPRRQKAKDETFLQRIKHFDPLGTVIFMPAVICLLLAFQWGGSTYAWSDKRVIALFAVSGILLSTFIILQYHQQEDATVPPRIIVRNRTVWASAAYSFCLGGSFFTLCYYVPLWFQAVQGVSAVDSGIRNLPMLISVVAASLAAGAAVTYLGHYAPFMIAGTVAMAAGAGLLVRFEPDTQAAAWVGYQLLFGIGVGLGMQQPLIAVQTALDDERDLPTGTSVVNFLQTLGGALFVSAAQAVFAGRLADNLAVPGVLPPGVDLGVVLSDGATNLRNSVPVEYVPGVVRAYNDALVGAFLVAAALAASTIFGSLAVEWRSVKDKKKGRADTKVEAEAVC